MWTVTCVIVGYDSGDDVTRSVARLTQPSSSLASLVVVDNGPASSASSSSCVALASERVLVWPYRAGRGFGAACSDGVNASPYSDAIIFINPDTIVTPSILDTLGNALRSHPTFGIVGAKLVDSSGAPQPSGGSFPTISGLVNSKTLMIGGLFARAKTSPRKSVSPVVPVDWVSGAVMMIRREAWDAVGGFDPAFFLYFEDIDLCLRVRAAGWEVGIVSEATAVHASGGSQWRPGTRTRAERNYFESQGYYFRKHHGRVIEGLLRALRFAYRATGLRQRFVSRFGVTVGSDLFDGARTRHLRRQSTCAL